VLLGWHTLLDDSYSHSLALQARQTQAIAAMDDLLEKIDTIVGAGLAALPATDPLIVPVVEKWAAAAVTAKEVIAPINTLDDLFARSPSCKAPFLFALSSKVAHVRPASATDEAMATCLEALQGNWCQEMIEEALQDGFSSEYIAALQHFVLQTYVVRCHIPV
jgi:hypothetical protein